MDGYDKPHASACRALLPELGRAVQDATVQRECTDDWLSMVRPVALSSTFIKVARRCSGHAGVCPLIVGYANTFSRCLDHVDGGQAEHQVSCNCARATASASQAALGWLTQLKQAAPGGRGAVACADSAWSTAVLMWRG